MQRVSIQIEDSMKEMLQHRAAHNHRSLSKEIGFLLDTAIAAEMETNIAILRLAQQAGQSELGPAQTEKVGLQPST
jgi:plasmid stability protein